MPWVRVDDAFYDHPKWIEAGPLGIALWITALAWSNRNLTDGFIPFGQIPRLLIFDGLSWETGGVEGLFAVGEDATAEAVATSLVKIGIFDDVPGGYLIHNYLKYQKSAEEIRDISVKRAESGRKGGLSKPEGTDEAGVEQPGSKSEANVEPQPQPQPQLRVPSEHSGSGAGAPPDVRVSQLVKGYIDDYAAERQGHTPSRTFKGACGKAVQRALKDGESVEDIARCLGVIAHESKNPSTLPYVLADYHAGRERRMK